MGPACYSHECKDWYCRMDDSTSQGTVRCGDEQMQELECRLSSGEHLCKRCLRHAVCGEGSQKSLAQVSQPVTDRK